MNYLNYLKKHILVSLALYLSGYMIYSFVTWTAINPFYWLTNINLYSEYIRMLILFNILIFHLIVSIFVELLTKVWKK